jgi:hypothetical protein
MIQTPNCMHPKPLTALDNSQFKCVFTPTATLALTSRAGRGLRTELRDAGGGGGAGGGGRAGPSRSRAVPRARPGHTPVPSAVCGGPHEGVRPAVGGGHRQQRRVRVWAACAHKCCPAPLRCCLPATHHTEYSCNPGPWLGCLSVKFLEIIRYAHIWPELQGIAPRQQLQNPRAATCHVCHVRAGPFGLASRTNGTRQRARPAAGATEPAAAHPAAAVAAWESRASKPWRRQGSAAVAAAAAAAALRAAYRRLTTTTPARSYPRCVCVCLCVCV